MLFLALATGLARAGADADLWGHVRFGQDLLASHRLVIPDTHSFTADKPWINHEWLAEVAMASVYAALGPLGLNLLRLACLALIAALLWRRVSAFSPPARILDALIVVSVLAVQSRAAQVRPQLFSLLLFSVLLTIVTEVDRTGDRRRLLFIAPLMALWANLHGGWIVGLEFLIIWVAFNLLPGRRSAKRGGGLERATTRQRITLIAAGVSAVLATAFNPYGVRLWWFLLDTVRVGRPYIEEWQPVYRLQGWAWLFWLLPLCLAAIAAMRSRFRLEPRYGLFVLLLAVTSLLVSRLDAFFTLAVAFLMAEPLATNWPQRTGDAYAHRRFQFLRPALAAIVIAVLPFVAIRAARIEIGHPPMPEREAAEFVQRAGLHGRVLVWFDWGEYVIWHFSPRLRVSIDGRRETVYSDELIASHMAFYLGDSTAVDLPTRIAADYIWVPKWIPVVTTLRDSGWVPIFEGPQSIVMARSGLDLRRLTLASVDTEIRAFPGP
jgi:hypothetical protein